MNHKIIVHQHDIPADLRHSGYLSIDTETMGLNLNRDRLCLIQVCSNDKVCHLVQVHQNPQPAPNLVRLLKNNNITKLFHFARFDLAMLYKTYSIEKYPDHGLDISAGDIKPVYCTKIASYLARTNSDRHSLKELCRTLIGVDLQKGEQVSDWGHDTLTESQKRYAASDVIYLQALREKLDVRLKRENREEMFKQCCDFLHTRVHLDIAGWQDTDIFAHGYVRS